MLKDDLERQNEWWFSGSVRKELAPEFRRYIYTELWKSLNTRQISILVGLRRIGKTTLLYQLISNLLQQGVNPESILYFSFEEGYDIKEVVNAYESYVLRKSLKDAGKLFFFFDEIHYSPNWAPVLKKFYDLYPNLKIVVSSSSSLLLTKESLEFLAGRFSLFKLKPMSFKEFLEFLGKKRVSDSEKKALFLDYLTKAGFPEIVKWNNEKKISEYIFSSVVDRIVMKDIPVSYGAKDFELSKIVLNTIFSNPGLIINVNEFSKKLGRSKTTLINYLQFLSSTLVIRILRNFRPSVFASSRKMKKYYPSSTSFIFAYSPRRFRENLGKVLETYAVNALEAKYYYRKGSKEVDIILIREGKAIPVEVKLTCSSNDLKKFQKVSKKFGKGFILALESDVGFSNEVIPIYEIEIKNEKL